MIHLLNVISNVVAIMVYNTLQYGKLRDSEQKYRALSENSNDGIAIIQKGMHVYANPRYKKITGYGFKELKNIAFETLLDCPTDSSDFTLVKSLLEQGTSDRAFEVRLGGKYKACIDVDISFSSIQHNGQEAVLLSVINISEKKELE